ncbi:hypothetical protein ACFLSA_04795, partial [Bacteroidota bacterium]
MQKIKIFKIVTCLTLYSVITDLQAQSISWQEAKDMLRSGSGINNSPAMAAAVSNISEYSAEANHTGDPIGGGTGYSRIITSGDYTVSNRTELLDALYKARDGEIIYVSSGSEIDMSGLVSVEIRDGVTLAGNRGHSVSNGPLIYTDGLASHSYPRLFLMGNGSRITGIRLIGPDPDYSDYTQQTKDASYEAAARGIYMGTNSEVDNNEIANFYRDGVIVNEKNCHVHHNYIHDIAAYPVVVGGKNNSSVLIEANLIYWGWHSFAGSGIWGSGYEVRYNIFEPHDIASCFGSSVNHCMDIHGDRELNELTGQWIAGDFVYWHHNTINLNNVSNPVGFKIRGTPRLLGKVNKNWFKGSEDFMKIMGPYGSNYESANGNVWIYDNIYGNEGQPLSEIIYRTTPQILFNRPNPPAEPIEKVSGTLELDVDVNPHPDLPVAGVRVTLNSTEIYIGQTAPEKGDVLINTTELSDGLHHIVVSAIDSRGALGYFDV